MEPVKPGCVLDGLRILETLGQGGTASVYLVLEEDTKEFRALKLMKPPRAGYRWMVDREWSAVGLVDHPNVVRVHRSVSTPEGHQGVLMDYVPGPTLREWRRQLQPELVDVVAVCAGILRGLAAIHAAYLAHRDLKPSNVILGVFGTQVRPVVLDFGVVKTLEEDAGWTAPDVLLGTPTYMSPEQLRDPSQVGPATDIYAAGVILLELLTGERMRRKPGSSEIFLRSPSPADIREQLDEDVPDNVVELVVAMLDYDPQARPTAVEALDQLVSHCADDDPSREGALGIDTTGGQHAVSQSQDATAHVALSETELQRSAQAPRGSQPPSDGASRPARRGSLLLGVAIGLVLGLGVAVGLVMAC